jgi:hypothetical protein
MVSDHPRGFIDFRQSPFYSRPMKTILALLLSSLPAQAAIDCKAMRLDQRGGYSEAALKTGTDRPDLYTASVKIEDAYFRIQGMPEKNRYSLTIYLDDPLPDGTAFFSDGAFDGDGFMRTSVVRNEITYKMICRK